MFNFFITKNREFGINTVLISYPIDFAGLLVIIGVLGIPIGYVIYQIYYVSSRSFPIDISTLIMPNKDNEKRFEKICKDWNKGTEDLNKEFKGLKKQGLPFFILKNFIQWIYRRLLNIFLWRRTKTIMERFNDIEKFEIKWAMIDVLLRKKIKNSNLKNMFSEVIKRDNHLSDIYHSLGTTNTSAFLACFIYYINLTKNLYFNINKFFYSDKLTFIIVYFICYFLPLFITLIYGLIAWYNRRKCICFKITFIKEFLK